MHILSTAVLNDNGPHVFTATTFEVLDKILADIREYNKNQQVSEIQVMSVTAVPLSYAGTLGNLVINIDTKTAQIQHGTTFSNDTTGTYTIPNPSDLPVKLNITGYTYMIYCESNPKDQK